MMAYAVHLMANAVNLCGKYNTSSEFPEVQNGLCSSLDG